MGSAVVIAAHAFVALVALGGLATPASAAPCGDEAAAGSAVRALELREIATTTLDPSYLDRCYRDLRGPLAKRFLDACKPILTREPGDRICVSGAVHQKKKALYGVDFFAIVRGWEQSPWQGTRTLELYALLANPEGAAIIIETWQASIDDAADRERTLVGWQRKQARLTWNRWRAQAAAVLGAIGQGDVRAFLAEQAKTDDLGVARACRDAVRALEARAPTPTTP